MISKKFQRVFNLKKSNLNNAGSYIALLEFSDPADATISCQIATERGIQGQYYEQYCRFEPIYRDLLFDLSEPQTVKINLETVEEILLQPKLLHADFQS